MLVVPAAHGGEARRTRERVRRAVASEILAEEQGAAGAYFVGDLVRPWMGKRCAAAVHSGQIDRLTRHVERRVTDILYARHRHTVPAFPQVRGTLGIVNAGCRKRAPRCAVRRILIQETPGVAVRAVIRVAGDEREERIGDTDCLCRRLQTHRRRFDRLTPHRTCNHAQYSEEKSPACPACPIDVFSYNIACNLHMSDFCCNFAVDLLPNDDAKVLLFFDICKLCSCTTCVFAYL